jgi:hypothetical protein
MAWSTAPLARRPARCEVRAADRPGGASRAARRDRLDRHPGRLGRAAAREGIRPPRASADAEPAEHGGDSEHRSDEWHGGRSRDANSSRSVTEPFAVGPTLCDRCRWLAAGPGRPRRLAPTGPAPAGRADGSQRCRAGSGRDRTIGVGPAGRIDPGRGPRGPGPPRSAPAGFRPSPVVRCWAVGRLAGEPLRNNIHVDMPSPRPSESRKTLGKMENFFADMTKGVTSKNRQIPS